MVLMSSQASSVITRSSGDVYADTETSTRHLPYLILSQSLHDKWSSI